MGASRSPGGSWCNGVAADYLSYVFACLVEGSDANRFCQGGNAQRAELGSLAAGASPDVLDKLIQKWLLGGDLQEPERRDLGAAAREGLCAGQHAGHPAARGEQGLQHLRG